MPDIEVREVVTRRDRDTFVRLPWSIYSQDPHWVPPLLLERLEFIDPKRHPFFLHGSAALFLAHRDGRCVGRILASDDPNYNKRHGTNTGCFGMFESIDDPDVAHALLDAAAAWLKQRGLTEIMGPIDYSTNYTCGLLVEGYNTPPRVMMGHNPPYYQALLESWGLAKAKDLFAWWFDDRDDLAQKWNRLSSHIQRRGQVTVRPINMKDLERDVDACQMLYNQAWTDNWGFVHMTDAEFRHLVKPLRWLIPAEYLLIAEIEGEVVGFAMCLPDFNEAMRNITNGKLFTWGLPLGLFRFLRDRRRIKTMRLVTLGVLEQYRRRGVMELMILGVLSSGKKAGLAGAELSWTLEDNEQINHAIRISGAQLYKRYRIFEKQIA